MRTEDVAGDGGEAESRWRVLYAAVAVFTLVLIASLLAFSRYFA